MTDIYNCLTRPPSRGNAVKCFSKNATEWLKYVLNQDHVDHYLNIRPRCQKMYVLSLFFAVIYLQNLLKKHRNINCNIIK